MMIGLIELWTGWMTAWAINRTPEELPAQVIELPLARRSDREPRGELG